MTSLLWISVGFAATSTDRLVGPLQAYTDVQSALDDAVAGDRVIIDPGTYVGDINATGLVDVEILGAGSDPVTGTVLVGVATQTAVVFEDASNLMIKALVIDGAGLHRGLRIHGDSTVTVDDVTLTNGLHSMGGAARVEDNGVVTFRAVRFEGNVSPATSAAGLRVDATASAEVIGCTFEGNTAGANGGGIWAEGELLVSASTFVDNSASDLGAGVFCFQSPDCRIEDSTFLSGSADRGAGVYVNAGAATLVRNTFCGNAATNGIQADGGAFVALDGVHDLRNNVFLHHRADDDGGALHLLGTADATIVNNTFVGNTAGGQGGAMRVASSTAVVVFLNNLVVDSVTGTSPFSALDFAVDATYVTDYTLFFSNDALDSNVGGGSGDRTGTDPLLPPLPSDCSATDVLPDLGSPTIDNGDPSITDPDGSASDIGATGGADAHRDRDQDGIFDGEDCDDLDINVSPNAVELCNGVDDDCDGAIDVDAADAMSWFPDDDQDGYGRSADVVVACVAPTGDWASAGGDCDDADAAAHPGLAEACGGGDEDCNGFVDDDDPSISINALLTWYLDGDGDGVGDSDAPVLGCLAPPGAVATGGDCDDGDASVFPGALEACDGRDQDCDGEIDEACDGTSPEVTRETLEQPTVERPGPAGCSCTSTGGALPPMGILGVLGALGLRRRCAVAVAALAAACGPTTPEPPPTPVVLPAPFESVTQRANPTIPTERVLTVALDQPAPVWAECTTPAHPDEAHLIESTEPSERHVLLARGLLADTDHDCTVHALGTAHTVSFTTGVPYGIPRMEVTTSARADLDGYTLFNTQKGAFTGKQAYLAIVDADGKVRWSYPVGTGLLADLDVSLVDADTVHLGGGWGIASPLLPHRGLFRTLTLSGTTLLERTEPAYGLGFNHHSEPLPDGSILSLTFAENTGAGTTWTGVGVEQWHPVDGLVWSWDSQQLVDQGVLPSPPPGLDEEDSPYHANSISLHTDALGDAAYLSLYGSQQIWRLDRETGDRTHVIGPGGDLALLDTDGSPLPDEAWMYVQHDPDYTDDGRVLVYDNGQDRPGGSYSRVAEFQLDLEAGTATLLWDWTEPGWYNPIVGDADYLPGGHVLVTRGFSLAWSPEGQDVSQILELDPATGEVVWRMRWPDSTQITFRSQRYGGCDVFANARYCPEVAERLAVLRDLAR